MNAWILRLTRRRWNRLIARVLGRAYAAGLINSHQLHLLCREFDPTQPGTVGKLPAHAEPLFAQGERHYATHTILKERD